ncbi:MAG: hypothetical protein U0X20_25045 [Caldilineaceae bacterium]
MLTGAGVAVGSSSDGGLRGRVAVGEGRLLSAVGVAAGIATDSLGVGDGSAAGG